MHFICFYLFFNFLAHVYGWYSETIPWNLNPYNAITARASTQMRSQPAFNKIPTELFQTNANNRQWCSPARPFIGNRLPKQHCHLSFYGNSWAERRSAFWKGFSFSFGSKQPSACGRRWLTSSCVRRWAVMRMRPGHLRCSRETSTTLRHKSRSFSCRRWTTARNTSRRERETPASSERLL